MSHTLKLAIQQQLRRQNSDATLINDDGTTTLTVYQSARESSCLLPAGFDTCHADERLQRSPVAKKAGFSPASAPSPITPLIVHLLPPSASEIIPAITRDLIKSGVPAEKVDQAMISRKVHGTAFSSHFIIRSDAR